LWRHQAPPAGCGRIEDRTASAFDALAAVALEHNPSQVCRDWGPRWLSGFLGAHEAVSGLKFLLLPTLALKQEGLHVVLL
jgi:hypothetical protein